MSHVIKMIKVPPPTDSSIHLPIQTEQLLKRMAIWLQNPHRQYHHEYLCLRTILKEKCINRHNVWWMKCQSLKLWNTKAIRHSMASPHALVRLPGQPTRSGEAPWPAHTLWWGSLTSPHALVRLPDQPTRSGEAPWPAHTLWCGSLTSPLALVRLAIHDKLLWHSHNMAHALVAVTIHGTRSGGTHNTWHTSVHVTTS